MIWRVQFIIGQNYIIPREKLWSTFRPVYGRYPHQDCRFLQQGDTDQPELKTIREAIKNRRPCRAVLRNYRQNGSLFWNELSITPVFNEADNLMYFIGIQKDVSAEIQTQERIQALEVELTQLKQHLKHQSTN